MQDTISGTTYPDRSSTLAQQWQNIPDYMSELNGFLAPAITAEGSGQSYAETGYWEPKLSFHALAQHSGTEQPHRHLSRAGSVMLPTLGTPLRRRHHRRLMSRETVA